MEPIISPIYIYAISFIKNLDAFLFIVMVVSLLAILLTVWMMAADSYCNDFVANKIIDFVEKIQEVK